MLGSMFHVELIGLPELIGFWDPHPQEYLLKKFEDLEFASGTVLSQEKTGSIVFKPDLLLAEMKLQPQLSRVCCATSALTLQGDIYR